ncbi:MAG: DUF5683 domain-containing protein [Endomicrobium sp.]|jgi:hypothetical protein|nr:DUF5683 domain-containing protein [Endomicrobium sp.]MDR2398862.1 DUF5683 domain-containing protein [Endomicrobium sp.]
MRKSIVFIFTIVLLINIVSPSFGDISLDLSGQTPSLAALRSAFIPGWGQAYNDQPKKAWITFWIFAVATGGTIYFNSEATKKYDEYKSKGLVNDDDYDKYKADVKTSEIFLAVAIVFYVFAIVDAYFMFDKYPSKLTAFNVNYNAQEDGIYLKYNYRI